MKNKYLVFFWSFCLPVLSVLGQCECYTVEEIEIPSDTTGLMQVTFINTCDDNVYLNGWVLDETGDTIASYDQCFCGAVLPLNTEVTWNFTTALSVLPPLSSLQVAISNGTLVCPDLGFGQISGISSGDLRPLHLYPVPAHSFIILPAVEQIKEAIIYSATGGEMLKINDPRSAELGLTHFLPGIYFLQIVHKDGHTSATKFIIH